MDHPKGSNEQSPAHIPDPIMTAIWTLNRIKRHVFRKVPIPNCGTAGPQYVPTIQSHIPNKAATTSSILNRCRNDRGEYISNNDGNDGPYIHTHTHRERERERERDGPRYLRIRLLKLPMP